ncbi:hypothetical protein KSP40_PGU018845 [Platanthera guangdongensis]|uniref:Uncharacterized protein n=1 Tax=Platanthera guangdongensis TaxID=2320717 RepID=A0ABR2LSP4_9ASPA
MPRTSGHSSPQIVQQREYPSPTDTTANIDGVAVLSTAIRTSFTDYIIYLRRSICRGFTREGSIDAASTDEQQLAASCGSPPPHLHKERGKLSFPKISDLTIDITVLTPYDAKITLKAREKPMNDGVEIMSLKPCVLKLVEDGYWLGHSKCLFSNLATLFLNVKDPLKL